MANEKRLIDANDVYALFDRNGTARLHVADIDVIPRVDAVEVVHGQWVRMDAHKGIEQFKCSICRSECYVPTCMGEPMYAYCPNCGAKMDGDRNG